MYFGSVRFFRHLTLCVLAVLIIVPTVLCIVLFNDNTKKDEEISRLNTIISSEQENDNSVTDSTASSAISSEEKNQSSESSITDNQPTSADNSSAEETSEPDISSGDSSDEASEPIGDGQSAQSDNSDNKQSELSDDEQAQPSEDEPGYTLLYSDLYAEKYSGEYINSDNTVYLTFDDGPSALTDNILYYLEQENVKATFFVVPEDTYLCKEQIRKIHDAGHTVGIHSYSHDYEKIYESVEAFLDDFYTAYQIVYEATGEKPTLYRFPGGSINDWNSETRDEIIAEMNRRGFEYYDWNVDSNDWQGYTWTQMYNNVTSDACELYTPVILFHDTADRENTVLVIEDIIKALKYNGYNFGSLSEKTEPIHF